MTEINGTNGHPEPATFSEAPASINLRFSYKNYHGIQLTLRANSGQEVLRKLSGALAKLAEMGATPAGAGAQSQGEDGNSAAPPCPTHGTLMKRSKHGDGHYCPQKIADDDGAGRPVYCKQQSK